MKLSSSDLLSQEDLEKMIVILKAAAHPTRLQIVNILMSGERYVGELTSILGTKHSNTSIQLGILKSRGILKSHRNGNNTFYSLANNSVKNIMTTILSEFD